MLTLRGVNLNPGADPEDMVAIRVWADDQRILSTRRRKLLSIEDVVASMENRPITGTADLIVRLATCLVDRMGLVIDDVEDQLVDMETAVSVRTAADLRTKLANLRREAIMLRRYLAPQREAVAVLQGGTLSWLEDQDRLLLREVSDRPIRYLEDLDAIRERAGVLREELMSRASEQLNQRMYLLSVVAAIFLPLGFLTGLLGVNVGGIPGAGHPDGFLIVVAGLAVLIATQLIYFVRKRWF